MLFKVVSKSVLQGVIVACSLFVVEKLYSIISPEESFGLYGIIKPEKRHLSPLIGMIYADAWLENMYKLGNNNLVIKVSKRDGRLSYVKRDSKMVPDSATHNLVELLFHCIPKISGVVPSALKDKPAYYLTPCLIGSILSCIEKIRGMSCNLIIKTTPKVVDDVFVLMRKKIQKEEMYREKKSKIAEINKKIVLITENQKKEKNLNEELQLKELYAQMEKHNQDIKQIKRERKLQLASDFYDLCKKSVIENIFDLCDENVVVESPVLMNSKMLLGDTFDKLFSTEAFIQLILKSLLESGEITVNRVVVEVMGANGQKNVIEIGHENDLVRCLKERIPALTTAQFLPHTVSNVFLSLLAFKAQSIKDYEEYFMAFEQGKDSLLLPQYDDFWENSTSLRDILERYKRDHGSMVQKMNETVQAEYGYENKLVEACSGRSLEDCFELIASTERLKRYPRGIPRMFTYASGVEVVVNGKKTPAFVDCAEIAFLNFMCIAFTKLGLYMQIPQRFEMSDEKLSSAVRMLFKREYALEKAKEEKKSIEEIRSIKEPGEEQVRARVKTILDNKAFIEFFKVIFSLSEKERRLLWVQLVSNIPGVKYVQQNYDLIGSAQNFVRLCNFFLATTCSSFHGIGSLFEIYDANMSQILSIDSGKDFVGNVKWHIKDGLDVDVRTYFSESHGEFYVKTMPLELSSLTKYIFGLGEREAINLIPLYASLAIRLVDRIDLLSRLKTFEKIFQGQLPLLAHMIYSHNFLGEPACLSVVLFSRGQLSNFCGTADKTIDSKSYKQQLSINHILLKNSVPKEIKKKLKNFEKSEIIKVFNQVDDAGCTPLHYAARYGSAKTFLWLITECGADICVRGIDGVTPLHLAAAQGNLEIVEWLVTKGKIDVNVKDNSGKTALHTAAEHGMLNIVEWLVTKGMADENSQDLREKTALHVAAEIGNLEIVEVLITKSHVDVNAKNVWGKTALHMAAEAGKLDIVEFLVIKGRADAKSKNVFNNTPLHVAVETGKLKVVEWLVAKGNVDVNLKGASDKTALHIAANMGKLEIVAWLVTKGGADIHAQDASGQTALHAAAGANMLEVVVWLVTKGKANTSLKDFSGNTPLHIAAYYGSLAVIKWLVSNGYADVKTKNLSDKTALSIAAENGYQEVVEWLKGRTY